MPKWANPGYPFMIEVSWFLSPFHRKINLDQWLRDELCSLEVNEGSHFHLCFAVILLKTKSIKAMRVSMYDGSGLNEKYSVMPEIITFILVSMVSVCVCIKIQRICISSFFTNPFSKCRFRLESRISRFVHECNNRN